MQHTVIGLFDTYVQAESARNTLVQTGFAREKIDLQANPEPSVGSLTGEVANAGVLANIERFLSSLFAPGSRAPDTARYAEAMRRGAVLVCVSAASESHAELARNTLVRLGATDIGDQLPDWQTQTSAGREYSVLDELGIGAVMPGTPRTSSPTTAATVAREATGAAGATRPGTAAENTGDSGVAGTTGATPAASAPRQSTETTPRDPLYTVPPGSTDAEPFVPPPLNERPTTGPVNEPVTDPQVGHAERSAIAAGSAPGSGAVMQPSEIVPESGQPDAGPGEIPNEYLEYEEDFRAHYDEQYASGNERYEDYVPAYRYGAEIGNDVHFRDRPWEEVEPEARRHWENTAPESTWERFKLAVRHGWERVTGHHHV
ncbi:hypothetical protein [Paraburkholderia susongensis]|uniref:Heat induced stress protein YflT n=1 Tax=Paraburkholderia susongensis TaxID=1515439 RepID=A0A1X7LZI8_9BURK|nr:hypothetical protein [Paraburkholderia susongensis]SMG58519.1 hypothetical protein SAMN06265784_11195 [Paraburkholderia susongensis]